jgi:PiT family inorganic phosphate transporter
MEPIALFILGLAGICAFFMAFNNGANDVANSFASAVGARAISIRQAVIIAGFMNLVGALLLGGAVSTKLVTGIVEPGSFPDVPSYIAANFAALLGAGFFVLLSTFKGLPVSSSHSIVGSLVGVSWVAAGSAAIDNGQILLIVISWFTSPLIAAFLGWFFYFLVRKLIIRSDPRAIRHRIEVYLPYGVGITSFAFLLILMKGSTLKALRPDDAWGYLLMAALVVPYVTLAFQALLRQWLANMDDSKETMESVFRKLQVGTSSYVAFAHGANDVANAISPVFAIYLAVSTTGLPNAELVAEQGVPLWILVLGGTGIAVGIGLLGHRVIATLSEKITVINNSKGFCIDTATATTVVAATMLGLPVSSTHAATGAIAGTGLGRGASIQLPVLLKIFGGWIVTLPAAALTSAGIYLLLKLIFLN